jgi:tetratricopeptide (TPR) repeat protein
MREIGEKLGVTYLLEGSVQKSGDQLRITAQMFKAEDGYQIWSETYARELKDIFSFQDDIAKKVTTALSITLGVGEFNRPGMTRNIEAYDEFLRGIANLIKLTPDSILVSIDQFKRALDIDPDFGLCWIALNNTYNTGIDMLPPGQIVDFSSRAEEALERARVVAPDMLELKIKTALADRDSGDWMAADQIFTQILNEQGHFNADSNNHYGNLLLDAGRSTEALTYLQRAKRLNPLEPDTSFKLAAALFHLKKIDESLTEARRGETLEGPN